MRGCGFIVGTALSTPVQASDLQIRLTGHPQVVFSSTKHGCDTTDIPDAPARAFRDAGGLVHLFATYSRNRAMVGKTLDGAKPDCRIVFSGTQSDDPSQYDDRAWLAGFFTKDGETVYALVHNEFQGHRRPWLCPSRSHLRCWHNSITFAVSHNGGFSFSRPPDALVAVSPFRYMPDGPRRIGAASPSNIIEKDGYFYFLYVNDMPSGGGRICIARTNKVSVPGSWRAWDGTSFRVRIGANPYVEELQEKQACRHLRPLVSGSMGSVTRHEPSGSYIIVQTSAETPERRAGIYYSFSTDLINWSAPALLWPVPTYRVTCETDAVFDYPSLLDPQSPSRNFEIVGDRPFLYLVRRKIKNCAGTWDRDLLRVPLEIMALR